MDSKVSMASMAGRISGLRSCRATWVKASRRRSRRDAGSRASHPLHAQIYIQL